MSQEQVDVFGRYGALGRNLLFIAVQYDNKFAINILLDIHPEKPWVLQELINGADVDNILPFHVAPDDAVAHRVFPQFQIHELILGESAIATQSSVVRRIWDSYEYETLQPYEETTFLPLPIDKIEEEEKEEMESKMRVS